MTCQPTHTPAAEEIDIVALRKKYLEERNRRLRSDGQTQYFRPTGKVAENYAVDPHKPVKPRDPVSEDIDVIVLGAGWGGTMAAYHLTQAGVTNFRNVDTAGDFGGVWYWNRFPGIQCDNDAYCYIPMLEETGFIPAKKFADGEIPRPAYWGGYRLTPTEIEFWQDVQFRLHDRVLFTRAREGQPWRRQRLYP